MPLSDTQIKLNSVKRGVEKERKSAAEPDLEEERMNDIY
jgi:hypothetical protein